MNAIRAFRLGYEIHSIDLPPSATHVEQPGWKHGRLVRGLPRFICTEVTASKLRFSALAEARPA